ncbi:AMP-binding protein [Nocardia crassostreae]|uniref:AMP-binding protein n=1 Tax=Nocardia crassostreae TaxID=53428 RepID=UPI00350E5537
MNDQGMGSWTTRRARMTPNRAALVQDGVATSYRELDERAVRLAHGLRGRGVERGDRVAYLGWNSVAFVETMFAVAKLGAVLVPLNTRLAAPETAFILADCGPRLLIADQGFDSVLGSDEVRALGLDPVAVDEVRESGSGTAIDEPISLDDLFMVQYTSGTTGRPKGVMLIHGNITWNVYNLLVDMDVRGTEIALVTAPLFHTAALNQVLFPVLLKGGTALIEAKWDPARALRLIENDRVTMLFGVTSMYQSLALTPGFDTADLSSLRNALSGGAPIPVALLETYRARGLTIIQGYGLTEASPCCGPPIRERTARNWVPRARLASSPTSAWPGTPGTPGTPAKSWSRARMSAPATGIGPTRPPPHSRTGTGCTPAIWAAATTTATSISSTGSRTCSSPAVRTSIPPRWSRPSTPTRPSPNARSSACPIRSGARSAAPSWCRAPARRSPRPSC